MKQWQKWGVFFAAILLAQLAVKVGMGFAPADTQLAVTPILFFNIGIGAAYLWYVLFLSPIFKRLTAERDKAVDALNKRTLPEDREAATTEIIARGIAAVYGNEINSTYRDAAAAVTPALVETVYDMVESDRLSKEGTATDAYLRALEESRDRVLRDYTKKVEDNYNALAKNTWDGLERINREIEKVKAKNRKYQDDGLNF